MDGNVVLSDFVCEDGSALNKSYDVHYEVFRKDTMFDVMQSRISNSDTSIVDLQNQLLVANARIAELERLISTAKKERAEIQKIIDTEDWKKQSRRYPTADRKKILKDVEYITVDKAGKPHITFKSIASMQTANLYLGQLIEDMNDLEEQGWEQELEELEKSKKAH